MASNTNIILSALDPDALKAQMINWFQNQSSFRDYNFSGSNLNVLMDVLARNDFLLAFFLNMNFSEGFNDSAQLRDSLVSKAKELNYIPYSKKSATTNLNITMNASGNVKNIEIPVGTIFSGLNSNGSFSFITDKNYISSSITGAFSFNNVAIYEGYYQTDLFSVDTTKSNQLFTLGNPNIDTSSLIVIVSEDAGAKKTIFTQALNTYGLNANSYIYFLQAASSNTYQFQFGDSVLGYIPKNGSVVSATYRSTSGEIANFIKQYIMASSISVFNQTTISNVYITSTSYSSGGSQNENIESIRFNNPRHYQTQDNAITSGNYKTLILEAFPSIRDVHVYAGGITNDAVQFGIIFIALVTVYGNPATLSLKSDIQSYINNLDVLNYQVSFVDPDILYLGINSNVHINFSQTNISPSQYISLISNGCLSFSSNYLEKFNTPFRYSVLGDYIDNLDNSIISNETSIFLKKSVNVILNTNNSIILNFKNPVTNVTSTPFIVGGNTYFLTDIINNNLQSGIVYLVQPLSNNQIAFSKTVGSINYDNGVINIPSLNISKLSSTNQSLNFICYPKNKDIYCTNNDIIEIDPLNLNINAVNN